MPQFAFCAFAPMRTWFTIASPPLMVIVPELVAPAESSHITALRRFPSILRSPLLSVSVEVLALSLLPTPREPAPPPDDVHHTVPPFMFMAAGLSLSTPMKLQTLVLLPPTTMLPPSVTLAVP